MKSGRSVSLFLLLVGSLAAQGTSEWVHVGPSHKLQYRTDAQGNRIMDFSSAGYKAGGVRLPAVAVMKKLSPIPGDNTTQIQAAIDTVSDLAAGPDGFRGAVLLQAGEYEVAGTVHIGTSGVVLRGTGSGDDGTIIKLTGSPHRFLEIRGSGTWQLDKNSTPITDHYIASGADSFHVEESSRFHVGDLVLVERPVTEPWIHFMGMDTLVRDGKAQTWIRAGSFIRTDRAIKSIAGNRITLDVPLTDSFDSKFLTPPGPALVRYAFPGRISQVGVESLRMVAPAQDVPISGPQYTVLLMDAVIDGWASDIDVRETQNGVVIGASAKRITLDSVRIIHAMPHSGAAAPADFSLSGTQIFLNRCSVMGEGTWPVVTQAMVTGPIVVLNFTADHAGVSPHQRWATGLLVDGAKLENTTARKQGIAFSNRNTAGSGHGWDIGWAVGWNVSSPYLLVQQPPGAMNWCIGCIGEAVTSANIPSGIFDSAGTAVIPSSLYLEQLRERLGDVALENIGYGPPKKPLK
jgi:hypothetical protein